MAVSSAQPPSSALDQLPRELLDGIASFLPTRDFNNLRLSCKRVENLLFPYWANCFFRVKQFMISDFSLNTLLDISRHPVLSKHLTHLAIGLDHLSAVCSSSLSLSNAEDLDWYHSALASQESMFPTGEAVRLLSAALANLPNLEYVNIRDYSSPTRYRDAGYWNSYGSSAHRQWDGLHGGISGPGLYTRDSDFTSKVFKALITALGQTSASRRSQLRRLDLIIFGLGCHDDAFALVRAPDAALRTMLDGLTTLHLSLRLRTRIYSLNTSTHYNFSTVHLQRFLTFTPNLTWLRLNERTGSRVVNRSSEADLEAVKAACAFFSWLALRPGHPFGVPSYRPLEWREKPMEPVAFPLKRLDLGKWVLPIQLWTALLQKYSDLEHLSFFNTGTTAANPGRGPLWAQLIRALPTITPGLKFIELRDIYEGERLRALGRVVFIDGPGELTQQRPPNWRVARDISDPNNLKELADSSMLHEEWAAKVNNEDNQMEQEDSGEEGSDDDMENPEDANESDTDI